MTDNTEFHPERLDVWTDTVEFAVERDRTVAYALATNDPIAAHRDGTLAPPVFAVVPAMTMMADATLGIVPVRSSRGRPWRSGRSRSASRASRRAWW